jgi:hypothetical protein
VKDLKSQKGSQESVVVDHKMCAGWAISRMACPSDTHLSFFIYLSTWRPEDKKSHCIARRGRGDAEDIPSSILEILRDNYFVEGSWE